MSRNEIPTEQARKILGDLVRSAQLGGTTTVLTWHGRPAAMLVPYTKETTVASNVQRLTEQVIPTLGDHADNFDVEAIVAEIGEVFGYDKGIDDIPSDAYWAIAERHDTTK